MVEEKLPFLETALRDALYGTADAPRIVGKRDEHDAPLLAAESDLDADAIAVALASRLGGRVRLDSVDARVALIEARRAATARTVPTLARTPMFCSGCPHNTSTANPDDTLLGAGIGCHTMVLLAPEGKGTITGITQMGGEGAQFVGMKAFTEAVALRPERRRRDLPPLRVAGHPLRRRRRARTSPTSCSTTTRSR